MVIKVNTSTIADIFCHLCSVSSQFVPELSSYVDIDKYSVKLYEKAQRIEIWNNGQLEGLLAYYLNTESRFAFITNVSISPRIKGKGAASYLLNRLIEDNTGIVDIIRLEVNVYNERARHFYEKNDFICHSAGNSDSIIMERCIIA